MRTGRPMEQTFKATERGLDMKPITRRWKQETTIVVTANHTKAMHEAPARMGVAGSEGYDERCAKAAGVQVRTGTSLWEELWSAVQNMLTTAERKDILIQGEQGEETMMDSQ